MEEELRGTIEMRNKERGKLEQHQLRLNNVTTTLNGSKKYSSNNRVWSSDGGHTVQSYESGHTVQ